MRNTRIALILLGLLGYLGLMLLLSSFVGGSPKASSSPVRLKPSQLASYSFQLNSDKQVMGEIKGEERVYLESLYNQQQLATVEDAYHQAAVLKEQQEEVQVEPIPVQQTPSVSSSYTGSYGSLPAIFDCIVQKESGGDPTAMNSSGAAGLFQFMPGTWADFGGYYSAADAPASVQIEKADQVYAEDGLSPWTGDPCVG